MVELGDPSIGIASRYQKGPNIMTTHGDADKVKGSVKEAAGKMTGDNQTEAEGKMDQMKGDAKNLADNVKDKVSEAKDKVSDTMKKATN